MATAKQKRERAVQIAIQWAKMPIVEGPRDNTGPMLDKYIKANYNGWQNGWAWCAAFCSAIGGYIDKEMGTSETGPSFKTNGSCSWIGRNRISPNNPVIGTIIMWKNNYSGSGTGHAGFVIDVKSDGSITTAEGNTSGDPSVNRNGGQTAVKFKRYKKNSWMTIKTKNGTRSCVGFGLLWREDMSSLKSNLNPDAQAKIDAAARQPMGKPDYAAGENSGSYSSSKEPFNWNDLGVDAGAVSVADAGIESFKPNEPVSKNSAQSKVKNNWDHELKIHSAPQIGISENSKSNINEPTEA